MEVWRKVPGYENYEISIATKEGKCRSLNWKHTGKIVHLSNKPDVRHGRIWWALYNNGKKVIQQAAVWIALTYPELIQNEHFEGAEIDHIDTDKLNNHPSNLRWVDRTGQMNNTFTKDHLQESMTNRPDLSKPVLQYSVDGEFIKRYTSVMDVQRQTGFRHQNISAFCRGNSRSKAPYGYIWRYA